MNRIVKSGIALALPCSILALAGCKDKQPSSDNSGLSAPVSPEVQRSVGVPPHATQVAHGSDKVLSYKPDQDGALYLSDEPAKRIVMRKNLRAGQSFEFSPVAGQAKIDGQVVFQVHPSAHEYKLYFEKVVD